MPKQFQKALFIVGLTSLLLIIFNNQDLTELLKDRSGDSLSELALFNRCYAHITQRALPSSHPMRAQVRSGAMSAIDACLAVLDSARLNSDGRLITDNQETRAVLETLYSFHRTWFPNDNLTKAITFSDLMPKNAWVNDETESSLHVTRALLANGVRFSEILTGTEAMEALRSEGPSDQDTNAPLSPRNERIKQSVNNQFQELRPELVQIGELIGIRPMSQNPNKSNMTVGILRDNPSVGDRVYQLGNSMRLHENHGGGIIGTKSYLLLNLGRTDYLPSNGGIRMNRRWSKAILADFLCRDLPALRLTDAVPLVQKEVTDATPPFRKSTSCMGCHATIDPMAATIRNLSYTMSGYVLDNGLTLIHRWPITSGPESGVVDNDLDYHQRPTNGKLFFRSYNGNLVDRSVTSLAELGQAISQTDDFYACAASRYVQFFTGVRANLQDLGDPTSQDLDDVEKAYREYVVELGQGLKSHQSLRQMIEDILRSDLYRASAMRF